MEAFNIFDRIVGVVGSIFYLISVGDKDGRGI